MNRLLVPTAALLWGLQAAFLSPALALILVSLFGASTSDVGWVLSVYNASGFVFSLLLPANADRKGTYLGTMAACGALTGALALSLALVTTLPLAVVALVVLGGPAGVGSSLLYAHLRHSGGSTADVVNTRAIFSVAWVAGPPLAALIIGAFGNRAILAAIVAVAVLNVATTAAMMSQHRRRVAADEVPAPTAADGPPASKLTAGLVMVAFVGLQATNAVAVSIMTIYVTQTMHLDIVWAGIALGVAAGLEVPALLAMGKLSDRYSHLLLIATGCLAGIAYYLGLAFVADPWSLLALQLLNAWFFAAVAGVGLPLFQDLIPRPGLATGLYMNTRRVGAIVSGPIIAIGALTVLGERGIFVACAALTLLALGVVGAAARSKRVPA